MTYKTGTDEEQIKRETTSNLFFRLIHIMLGRQSRFDRVPTAGEWHDIFAETNRQALCGVLFSAVETLPREQLPPKDILLRWYAMRECIVARNLLVNRQVTDLANRMERDGMRPCLLKGQGVATLYANPLWRVPGDIDLWLRVSKRQTIAYVRNSSKDGGYKVCPHHIDLPVSDGTPVELHFYPAMLMNPLLNMRLQAFFREQSSGVADSHAVLLVTSSATSTVTVNIPSASFNAVFLLVHTFKHFISEGVGLRQMMDYYYLLERGLVSADKTLVCITLRRLHLIKFAGAMMYVLQMVFGLPDYKLLVPSDEKEGRILLNTIMSSGNFGQYSASRPLSSRHGSHLVRYLRSLPTSLRLLRNYPLEVMFAPLYNVYFFFHLRWYRR